MVDTDHALTTTVATEASPPDSPDSVLISGLIPVSKQLSSATSDQELETPLTVSDYAVLTIVLANY